MQAPSEQIGDGPISVQVDPQKLKPGEYTGVVTVSGKRASVAPVTTRIRLSVLDAGIPPPTTPELKVQPLVLLFSYRRGGNAPAPQSLQLSGRPSGETWEVTANDPWIKAPSEKTGDGPVSILVEPLKGNLGLGDHSGTVTVSSKRNPGTRVQVGIRLNIQDATPPPLPTVDCHAADYTGAQRGSVQWQGLLMPGQAVTIGRNNVVAAGSAAPTQAKAIGRAIPGCDVSVTPSPQGIEIAEFPTAANGYGVVTLRNTSSTSVTGPKFDWAVK
jgi:hypothetical protein